METMLADLPIMFVESPNGPAGSSEAFKQLESCLESLKGRKFYATFHYSTGLYRACVALDNTDDPKALGLEVGRIPGGKYTQRKLDNWTEHVDEIPDVFRALTQEYAGRIDSTRPNIEFYKSQKELLLMLPIQ